MPKNKKLALKIVIQTYQILTNDDEVCIPGLSGILLAVQESLEIVRTNAMMVLRISKGIIFLFECVKPQTDEKITLPTLKHFYIVF